MPRYLISGLTVESEDAIPGGIALTANAPPGEITILRGDVPAKLDDATVRGPNWQLAQGRILLTVPGLIRILIEGGRSITYAAEAGADLEEGLPFVTGMAFGALLHQRGDLVLHASAVDIGGRAVAFCGVSGSGKSTLAAALDRHGHALVADDICRVTFDGSGRPLAQPDGRRLKLWTDATTALGLDERRGPQVRWRFGKYFVEPNGARVTPLPLAALYLLGKARHQVAMEIEPLSPVAALAALRGTIFRPRLVRELRQEGAVFTQIAQVLRAVRAFDLPCRRDWESLPALVERLRTHWTDLGR
jgi:hypothetical protein